MAALETNVAIDIRGLLLDRLSFYDILLGLYGLD
jgi:hypothetical protein